MSPLSLLMEWVPWILLLASLVTLTAQYHDATGFYTPDSWSYYELSKSVGDDFYRIHTIRTFEFVEPYGSSFPPLWPITIALGRSILPAGPETGILLNITVAAATAVGLEWLFRNMLGFRGAGPLTTLFLLSFTPYREEVLGGRSMPLVLLEVTLLGIALLYASDRPLQMAVVSGLLLGMMVMTRFDWLVPAILVLVWALALQQQARMLWLLFAFGTFFISLLPWVAYSLLRFGEVFVSDNSVVALSAESRYVLDFLPTESPTIFTRPVQWVARLANNVDVLWGMSKRAIGGGLLPGTIVLGSLLLGRAVALLPRHRTRPWRPGEATKKTGQSLLLLWVLGPAITLQALLPPIVLGYGDARYATGLALLVVCSVVAGIVMTCRSPSCGFGVGSGVLLAGTALVLLGLPIKPVFRLPSFPTQPLAACVPDRDVVMVVGNDTMAAKLGALHEQRAAMLPSNLERLDSVDVENLVQRFNIRFVFVPSATQNGEAAALLNASTISLQPSSCLDGLYEVRPASFPLSIQSGR